MIGHKLSDVFVADLVVIFALFKNKCQVKRNCAERKNIRLGCAENFIRVINRSAESFKKNCGNLILATAESRNRKIAEFIAFELPEKNVPVNFKIAQGEVGVLNRPAVGKEYECSTVLWQSSLVSTPGPRSTTNPHVALQFGIVLTARVSRVLSNATIFWRLGRCTDQVGTYGTSGAHGWPLS